jgi:hypothetical protein
MAQPLSVAVSMDAANMNNNPNRKHFNLAQPGVRVSETLLILADLIIEIPSPYI